MPSGQKNGRREGESWSANVERRLYALDLKIKLLFLAVLAPKAAGVDVSDAVPALVQLV